MFVIQIRKLVNDTPLYLGRNREVNCRAIEEAQVFQTATGAEKWITSRNDRTAIVVPVSVGDRTKSRGIYAKAAKQEYTR